MNKNFKQVIIVANKSYAVGLFWQPLNDKKNPLLEIEKTSKSLVPQANYYCIKTFGNAQYGLAFRELGHRDKQFVAAISLTSVLKDKPSILSCLKTQQGYWLCAVRNGLILPEDDALFETEDEAKAHYLKLLELPDWAYKIAPVEWRVDGSSPTTIEELFERESYQRLLPLKKQSTLQNIILISIFVLFIALVYKNSLLRLISPAPKKPKQDSALLEKYKPEKLDKGQPEGQTVQTAPGTSATVQPEQPLIVKQKDPTLPWQEMDDIIEFAAICKKAVSLYSKPIFGWDLKTITCNPTTIEASYTRNQGDISIISKAFDKYFKPILGNVNVKFDDNGENVSTSISQPKFTKVSIAPTEPKDIVKKRFLAFSQRTSIKIQTEFLEDQAINGNIIKKFSFMKFTFNSKLDIIEWAKLFRSIGSAEFKEIVWDQKSQTWKVEGRVYEKD